MMHQLLSPSFAVLINGLGWALLQFLWQGLFLGCFTASGLFLLRTPKMRYQFACVNLLTSAVLVVWNFYDFYTSDAQTKMERVTAIVDWSGASGAATASNWLQAQLSVIAIGWLVCVAVLSLRMMLGLVWLRRYRADDIKSDAVVREGWQLRANALCGRLGVATRRFPVIKIVENLKSPLQIGWHRPVVLLPSGLVSRMPVAYLEALLAHELAHIRRHDYLMNLLQNLIEILLFYHPAVWWISRRIRVERELIADETAAQLLGEPRRLALALNELANYQLTTPRLALAAHGGLLMSRIKHLLGSDTTVFNWKSAAFVLALSLSSLYLYANTAYAVSNESAVAASKTTHDAKIDFNQCRPEYPAAALKNNLQGTLVASFLVAKDGTILRTKVDKSTGSVDLDDAVLNKAKTCKGIPAEKDGKTVQEWIKIQYVWRLD